MVCRVLRKRREHFWKLDQETWKWLVWSGFWLRQTLSRVRFKDGRELWVTKMEMSAHAIPITYQGRNGKQYVAIVAGGASALDDPAPAGAEALLVFAMN